MSARLARLEELKALLAEREYTTADDLAADLGVSLRTLHRDIETLRELGVPVAGTVGRGGGLSLERGHSLGRVHLNETEAMSLLLSLAIAEKANSPLLLGDLRSVERKIIAAFAPSQVARIRSLRRRVLIGDPASSKVRATYGPPAPAVTRKLLESFTQQREIEIGYTSVTGVETSRLVEVHYLLYSQPVWYALSWDLLRRDVRSFRVDRIGTIELHTATFRLRPVDAFADSVETGIRHV